jgi:nucleotide-binding universal stress UspA family protein
MEQSIENILCCVGLRSDSHVVLEQAFRLSSTTGAKLHILHAVKSLDDDVMNTLRVNIRDKNTLKGLMQRRLDEAYQKLEGKLENFLSLHADDREALSVRIAGLEVIEGYPAKVIVDSASKLGCDLIVMAANKHGFTLSYVGKVTRGVLKRSHVPVVVVPPPA